MGKHNERNVTNVYARKWRYGIYGCLLVLVSIILFGIYSLLNYRHIVKNLITDTSTGSTTSKYKEVTEVIDNVDNYLNTRVIVCGYLCDEIGTDTGIAWLTTKPERDRLYVDKYIIRLENDDVFEYTPEAIAVRGTLVEETDPYGSAALVIKDAELYKYEGDNQMFLMYNELVEADAVTIVATALAYGDNTDIESDLTTLKVIATRYNSTELLEILNAVEDVYNSKFNLDQTSFENSAEQVWDRYISFLLEE